MDCVGCDKCRLWGGLQVSGLGTALKFLFGASDCDELWCVSYFIYKPASKVLTILFSHMQITRAEVVAFFNTLHRLSESLAAIEEFRDMLEVRSKTPPSALPVMEQHEQSREASPSPSRPEPHVYDPALEDTSLFKPDYAQLARTRTLPERHRPKFVHNPQPPRGDANVFLRGTDAIRRADGSIDGVALVSDVLRTLWSLLTSGQAPARAAKDEL